MSDSRISRDRLAAKRGEAVRLPSRLVHEARASLRATDVYSRALSDRFELLSQTDPGQLGRIPADILPHLIAVSDAFQDGARQTLWLIEPQLARSAQRIADLERDKLGERQRPPSPPTSTANLKGTMATVKHAVSEHDVVVLREPVGAWPAGTTGAVISAYDDTVLVEITGPGGKTLDTIQVPADRLDVKHG